MSVNKSWLVLWTLCAGLVASGLACRQDEGKAGKESSGSVAGTAGSDFFSFSRGESPASRAKELKTPEIHFVIAGRRWERVGRPTLHLEIELPMRVSLAQIRGGLRAAAMDPEAQAAALVEVVAWPGRLRLLAGPYGRLWLARDGAGVPGTARKREQFEISDKTGAALELRSMQTLNRLEQAIATGGGRAQAKKNVAAGQKISANALNGLLDQVADQFPPPQWMPNSSVGVAGTGREEPSP